MSDEIGARFAAAIAAQDPAGVGECLAPDVEFRALTPPGLRERRGATEVAALIAQWFGDSSDLHLLDSHCDEIGDRLHISYRCAGLENGEAYVVEHHLFCIVSGGKIQRADLLCSGFRPPTVTSA